MPEKKFRAGGITATIWKNKGKTKEGNETEFKTVSFERSYMDKEGEWQTTSTLRVGDLPRAEVVLKKAYEHLVLKEQDSIVEEVVC